MTPKQILDSFSQTLIEDERILSKQERGLLAALLKHSQAGSDNTTETNLAVQKVISAAVGETIAHRAFGVLGGSVVERILNDDADRFSRPATLGGPPTPITPGPPHTREPEDEPIRPEDQPPMPQEPQPPHASTFRSIEARRVATLERPRVAPRRCVVLDEFLAPHELQELTKYAMRHEIDFRASEVLSPVEDTGIINYEHRRSRVLMNLDEFRSLIVQRLMLVLPQVLPRLGIEEFAVAGVDVQMTASNDRDFFRLHSDNGSAKVAARQVSFVYFFHREPRAFEGGELRICDSNGQYESIAPQQNQIVFFPCSRLHEITAVECRSGLFADSRFTVNGWIRK